MPERALPGDQIAGYDVARDLLTQLVAYASDRISQLGPDADPAEVGSWRNRRDEWIARRRDLDPRDASAVGQVLQHDAAELNELLRGGRE